MDESSNNSLDKWWRIDHTDLNRSDPDGPTSEYYTLGFLDLHSLTGLPRNSFPWHNFLLHPRPSLGNMDSILPQLLSFPPHPPPAVPLSDKEYDKQIKGNLSLLNQTSAKRLTSGVSGGGDLLEVGQH